METNVGLFFFRWVEELEYALPGRPCAALDAYDELFRLAGIRQRSAGVIMDHPAFVSLLS